MTLISVSTLEKTYVPQCRIYSYISRGKLRRPGNGKSVLFFKYVDYKNGTDLKYSFETNIKVGSFSLITGLLFFMRCVQSNWSLVEQVTA